MNEYNFSASLRITHPTLTASEVIELLGMQPDVVRSLGDNRVSPTGRSLSGVWKETYVAFEYSVMPDDTITTLLARELPLLKNNKVAIHKLTKTGGVARCYILATPCESTFGEEITSQILHDLADLDFSLCLEVFQDNGE